jgi:hypothetical protein
MVESRTANRPAEAPPNHALAITAPKKRKRNGYGNKGCSNNVQIKANPTESKVNPALRINRPILDRLDALYAIADER